MHINPTTFQTLLQKRGWTQAELSRRSKVATKTIGRIKHGDELRRTNVERLAQAFGVSVEVLLNPPSEDLISAASKKAGTERLVLDIDGSALNALWITARHYNVSMRTIVQFAPLLFSIVAERSLQRRQEELDGWLKSIEALAAELPAHGDFDMDLRLMKEHAYDIYDTAKEAIDTRDLSARIEGVYSTEQSAFQPHPFFETIEDLAVPDTVSFYESTIEDYSCLHSAHERAVDALVPDGFGYLHSAARAAIGIGYVLVRDMPEDLLPLDRTDDRVKWLASFYGGAKGDFDAAMAILHGDPSSENEADEAPLLEDEDA